MTDHFISPLPLRWDGESFRPRSDYFLRKAQERFKPGEDCVLEQVFERSPQSHAHYFASVHEAWANLPEQYRLEYPTSEHLRKKALILRGWHDRQDFPCASKAEALRAAAMLRSVDQYAVVVIDGSLVSRLTAKSQAHNKMKKADFQRSKSDVLEYVWGLCGVDAETGEVNTGRAA